LYALPGPSDAPITQKEILKRQIAVRNEPSFFA
jgi:hypothetical protein